MRNLLWCLLFCACGSLTGPPQLSETVQDAPDTGSITIIVCWDGVCPVDTPPPDTLGYCIFDCNGAYKPETPPDQFP